MINLKNYRYRKSKARQDLADDWGIRNNYNSLEFRNKKEKA